MQYSEFLRNQQCRPSELVFTLARNEQSSNEPPAPPPHTLLV